MGAQDHKEKAAAQAVARCDAGTVLDAAGALITTGATGSNLADLYLVVTA